MTTTPHPSQIILMHDPEDELFPGVLHPDAALFADYFDVRKANREHRRFQQLLVRNGFDVRTVRDILLSGTTDPQGEPLQGPELDGLRKFAARFLEFTGDATTDPDGQESYKRRIIGKAHPRDLVKIIFNRPRILLHSTPGNTGFSADYQLRPMMNLLFMRDQMITTAKGVVVGRLHSPQRTGESLVAEFCLRKLGIRPLLRVKGEGSFLEGGDFVPSHEIAFIGCGMRTTRAAIDELLRADVFGTETVVLVKDRLHSQAQMHLDTCFNLASPRLALLSENRFAAAQDNPAYLRADIYRRGKAGYALTEQDCPFTDFLRTREVEVIPVGAEDCRSFGVNFLALAPDEIVAVTGKTAAYKAALRRHGIKTHWIDLTHCTKGYGAAHCLTQMLGKPVF